MNQMLKLSEKNFNVAIIKVLQQSIANSLETNEKWKILAKKYKLSKYQMEMIELKLQ